MLKYSLENKDLQKELKSDQQKSSQTSRSKGESKSRKRKAGSNVAQSDKVGLGQQELKYELKIPKSIAEKLIQDQKLIFEKNVSSSKLSAKKKKR